MRKFGSAMKGGTPDDVSKLQSHTGEGLKSSKMDSGNCANPAACCMRYDDRVVVVEKPPAQRAEILKT